MNRTRPEVLAWGLILLAAACAVLATATLFGPSSRDLAVMAVVLILTGSAGAIAAATAPRWAGGLSLRGQLLVFCAVGLGGLLLNIATAAGLMFISGHDLRLLFVLSGFAFVATLGAAQIMSTSVSRRFDAIRDASQAVGAGDLSARAAVSGGDEVAAVAASFNGMAEALQTASRQRDELEQARRDLFAAISHDLRTPLATIRVMVEAMVDGVVADRETGDRYLATIGTEVQRLSALIDDLFELTTIDSGELRLRLERLQVEEVIAETVDAFRPQVEQAGIHLSVERLSATGPIEADGQRLSRVLYNLLQNALRHTPSDGTITLRSAASSEGVEVAVIDTGEGIAAEDLPHVFERFYRGEKSRTRERGGSGLGLAIARGIVEAHGGRIWAESNAGRGATVGFTLPRSRRA